MKVAALISGANAAGIVGSVVRSLVDDGIRVWFLDEGSSDQTVAEVEAAAGTALLGVERLGSPRAQPDDSTSDTRRAVLHRKEDLASAVDADWIIHGNAVEFHESPWPAQTLREAIDRVDAQGHTAIAFRTFTFVPTAEDASDGRDVRQRQHYFEPNWTLGAESVVAWKRSRHRVSLVASGGQQVDFPDRRICPVRFVLREYPRHDIQVSGEAAGASLRAPVRAPGWTLVDDGLGEGVRRVPHPSALKRFDAEAERFRILVDHRELERVERLAAVSQDVADRLTDELVSVRGELAQVRASAAEQSQSAASMAEELSRIQRALDERGRELATSQAGAARLQGSLSWKLTAPLRALDRLVRRGDP